MDEWLDHHMGATDQDCDESCWAWSGWSPWLATPCVVAFYEYLLVLDLVLLNDGRLLRIAFVAQHEVGQ